MSIRDTLRQATLGAAPQFKSEMVQVGDQTIEVRAPTVQSRSDIFKAAKLLGGDPEKMEWAALQVTATIECCFVPGTPVKVFERADVQAMLALPTGTFLDEVAKVVMSLMNVSEDEVEKNS